MKEGICTAVGVVGSAIAAAFGGWDQALVTLVIFMVIAYLSGLIVAGIFHNSRNKESYETDPDRYPGWFFRKRISVRHVPSRTSGSLQSYA